jgi:hypothetical protein
MNFSNIANLTNLLGGSYSPDCLSFILDASAHNYPLLAKYFELSGHGINQIGNFEACKQLDNSSYYLGYMGQPPVGFVGICFSDTCSSDDIKELSVLLDPYNFSSVVDPSMKQNSMPIGGYIVIGVMAIFLLLTLFSTLFVWLNQRKNNSSFGFIENYDYFAIQRSVKVFKKSG